MKGWQMYSKIQALKEKGFSIRQVSQLIRVSRNTIRKYWDMPADEYAATLLSVNKLSALAAYEPPVLHWLESFPCMTAAQVRDWLCEKYRIDAAERTVRRFVAGLRERNGITKITAPRRDYEAVDELPMGFQLQMDFGSKSVRNADSSRYTKLYVAAFSLSYSRYKWGVFQEKPFTSEDLVRALYGCFEYIGGMPRQLVYDQDSILVVSENNGDIIHTHAFAAFLQETHLETLVCRRSDPETKGKIEAVVRFIKGNFIENRLYMGLGIWNQSFEEWLERTGNGRVHETTKHKPSELFLEEQEHLLPLFGTLPQQNKETMSRTVRKDNTVLFRSNRYSLPLGTFNTQKTVDLEVVAEQLRIYTTTGDLLAEHPLCPDKGKLIKADAHRYERNQKIRERLEKAVSLLGEEFREYLTALCLAKPRYVKEQLALAVKTCESYGRETTLKAVAFCCKQELWSASDLAGAAASLVEITPSIPVTRLPVNDEKYHIDVQIRPLSIYSEAALAVRR
jgi:transposase